MIRILNRVSTHVHEQAFQEIARMRQVQVVAGGLRDKEQTREKEVACILYGREGENESVEQGVREGR